MSNRYFRRVAAVFAGLLLSRAAHAALSGQPALSPEAAAKIKMDAATILRGEIATGRPDLLLVVEANAAADFTPLVARVVGDDTTYNGLAATLEEAVGKASTDAARKNYLLYNLANLHLLRSQLVRSAGERRAPLNAAADATDGFGKDLHDPAAWELKGDVHAEQGDLDGALSAYRQMTESGADGARVQYKMGFAYERANRMALAEKSYTAAATAQMTTGAGGPKLRHLIYQGLTRTEMAQGNDPAALAALARSAKVGQDDAAPFSYRLDAARRLLQRGYGREVKAYADAAVAAMPDDADAAALRAQAAAQTRKH